MIKIVESLGHYLQKSVGVTVLDTYSKLSNSNEFVQLRCYMPPRRAEERRRQFLRAFDLRTFPTVTANGCCDIFQSIKIDKRRSYRHPSLDDGLDNK